MAKANENVPAQTPAQAQAQAQGRQVPVARRMGDPFVDLRNQIDRVFDTFLSGFGPVSSVLSPFMGMGRSLLGQPEMSPQVDVSETDDAVVITADLPGLEEKDVDITLANGVLTLKGEKKGEREEKEPNYYLMERSYGSFSRSFRLPETVDQDKCQATFDKGVLKITLPKAESAKAQVKHISIKKAA